MESEDEFEEVTSSYLPNEPQPIVEDFNFVYDDIIFEKSEANINIQNPTGFALS